MMVLDFLELDLQMAEPPCGVLGLNSGSLLSHLAHPYWMEGDGLDGWVGRKVNGGGE